MCVPLSATADVRLCVVLNGVFVNQRRLDFVNAEQNFLSSQCIYLCILGHDFDAVYAFLTCFLSGGRKYLL